MKPGKLDQKQPNSLGLDEDLDNVELIMDIEKSFNVGFSDKECEGMITVGDIYRRLLEHLPRTEEQGVRFATVMSFNRLRASLQPLFPGEPLRPGTSMARFADVDVQEIYRPISQQTGLATPDSVLSRESWQIIKITWAAVALAIGGGWYFGMPWWGILLSVILAFTADWIVLSRMTHRLPPQFDTFGALVTWTAHHNIGAFMQQGARASEKEVWSYLLDVLEPYTFLKRDDITPETLLLA